MPNVIHQIIAELKTPSGQTGPLHGAYDRAVQGLGHAMIGAAMASVLGWYGLAAGLAVALAYWLVKEAGDIGRGGDVRDGIEDALMVWLGCFYGPWWWPMLMLGCGAYLMVMGARRGLA